MKLTATVTLRLSQAEVEGVELLREKGISNIDVFRRGLAVYVDEILKCENSVDSKTD